MKTKSLAYRSDRCDLQFKLLSAIGMILVVSGHCYQGGISLAYEWFPVYSFQLSLFVFISGYFYKPRYERTAFRYIWKRMKRLVIPAYLWNIVYGLFILLMTDAGYTIGAEVTPYNLFVMPLTDGEAFQYNLGSWFVYPLFLVSVCNVLLRKCAGFLKIKNEYVFLVVYFAVGVLGIRLAADGQTDGMMKLLTRAMFFLPSFQLSRIYRSRWEKRDRLNSFAYFSALFVIQLMLMTFCHELQYYPSGMTGFQNGIVIPYITSVTGIAFWLRISKLLAPVIGNSRIVRLIADNTYSIMIHHLMGFMAVKWLFLLLSRTTPLFSDFSIPYLRSTIWYYYLPKGLERYAILYLAAGIFIPIGIKKLCGVYSAAGSLIKDRLFDPSRKMKG